MGPRLARAWTASIVAALVPLVGSGIAVAQRARLNESKTKVHVSDLALERNTAVELEVFATSVASLELPTQPDVACTVTVPIEGELYTLDLIPHSTRAPGFVVLAQIASGELIEIDTGPSPTMRGTLREIPGSIVSASILEDGLHARVILPDQRAFWIEPIYDRVAGTRVNDHAIYRDVDVIPHGGTCVSVKPAVPVGAAAKVAPANATADSSAEVTASAVGGLFITELVIDADFPYFQDFGSVEAAAAKIESIIDTMNLQYERDVSIRHIITAIVVRTSQAEDPYSGNNPSSLLNQVSSEWRTGHIGIARDVVQLFTGRNLSGATIGIAWVGSVCDRFFQYSVVESNCGGLCSNFSCQTDLSAHELGHSWDANHCGFGSDDDDSDPCSPSCPGFTMNCGIQCANVFHPTNSIPPIVAHRNSRSCLDMGDDLRRLILTADTDSVSEGGIIQLTATADFEFGPNENVSSQAIWSIDRTDVATISTSGRLRTNSVDSDTCVTVFAEFAFDGITRSTQKSVMIIDQQTFRAIVDSSPPNGAIDARQPTEPDGTGANGWSSIDLTYNGDTCLLRATDFNVSLLEQLGNRTIRLDLGTFITPGTWNTLTDATSGLSVRIGSLPGDVNGDGVVDENDLATLLVELTSGATLPIWSIDIDRNGTLAPPDLLRLIDLFSGADFFDDWNGRTLPP